MTRTTPPSAAPMLAVVVCHNGSEWLPRSLEALAASTVRPRHILAVDTGSQDDTDELLADARADGVVDGVLTMPAGTGFGAAVAEAVASGRERWGDAGPWIWLLHDDSAPEPECLDVLLRAADAAPSAGILGPLALDWNDERLIVEAGLSLDSSGHRQPGALAGGGYEQSVEVLAVPSAGALISAELWDTLDGFDPALPLLRDDVDLGWRANAADSVVLCVPSARLRHACAVSTGQRHAHALSEPVTVADRAHGLRTFLVNAGRVSFLVGLPRLVVLCLLRGLGFFLLRNGPRAHAEFAAIGYLTGGRAGLRAARAERRDHRGSVRGLFTGRVSRLRNTVRSLVVRLVRSGLATEAALGRLPESSGAGTAWKPPQPEDPLSGNASGRRVGPAALPTGALRGRRGSNRQTGLRRPAPVVAVAVPEAESSPVKPSPGQRREDVLLVEVDRKRILAATLFAPPVVLFVVLGVLGLLVHAGRLGFDLSGGALLPVGGLGEMWSTYLATWHPGNGGTATGAPVSLALLGILGAPIGGPAVLVALLLLADLPLAALSAYAATSRIPVRRWVRAGAAAAYALLPAATASVTQGRLDVVVVHLLAPPVIAGIVAVLTRADRRWLSIAVLTSLALAVLGAFAPIGHALALTGLLLGYLVTRGPGGQARRAAGVITVVVLPLLLLLPWLPTLFANPLLLKGSGGPASTWADLFGLHPGGPGGWPVGILLVAATLVAAVVRPSPRMVPGLALAVLGIAGVVLASLFDAGTAVPLMVVGAGLLWSVLGTSAAALGRSRERGGRSRSQLPGRLAAAGVVVVLLGLSAGVALRGPEGPLGADRPELTTPLMSELASTGRSALVLGSPARQPAGGLSKYGDESLIPVSGTAQRLDGWQRDLLSADPARVRSAAGFASADGVLFVVLPYGVQAEPILSAGTGLIATAPPANDGRQVVRLTPTGGQVALVSPEQARRSVNGEPPADVTAVSPVDASPPDVRVRVSDGPEGRLLVLAAEVEPGWRATVNGEAKPVVLAWGHQVAVAVPPKQSDVTLERVDPARGIMLLGQVAAVLFTALTAIPGRRPTHPRR